MTQSCCHLITPLNRHGGVKNNHKFVLQWIPMMEASPWWWSLRWQPQGQEVIRDLLRQMLSALAVLQAANITHRYLYLPHVKAHHDTCKGPSKHTQNALDSVSGHVLQPPGFFWDNFGSLRRVVHNCLHMPITSAKTRARHCMLAEPAWPI